MTVRHPYIKFVQSYPFFQQREIPIGLILKQSVIKCQSHLIKVERPTVIVICLLKSIMEEQITSNEFSLPASQLRFDGETLNSIRSGEVQVVYATAEQVLREQGCLPFTLNHPDEKFTCNGK